MGKLLASILMLIAFIACSKDDDSGNSIKKATVKGAQLIYQNSVETRAGTRATTEEVQRFMTVDNQGNVKPIRFITENGDTLDMSINNVYNLDDNHLLLCGFFTINPDLYYEGMLVNKNTEAVYLFQGKYETNVLIDFRYVNSVTYSDKYGCSYVSDGTNVFKFNTSNPNNITIEKYLPDEQYHSNFIVNETGLCYYYEIDKKFKCPGSRIYNAKELIPNTNISNIFCGFNQHFYIVTYHGSYPTNWEIYKLDEIGNNELKATKITEWESDKSSYMFYSNHKRKTHIAFGYEEAIEFNEETGEIRKLDITVPPVRYNDWTFLSSESFWSIEETELYQLNLDDYSLKKIDLIATGYEIKAENITCSNKSLGLSFSGLRYSDGQNVIGTINENGTITAFEKTKSSAPIISLLRIN